VAAGGNAVRVLLIEDSASDAELARRALAARSDPPYSVRHVDRLTKGLPLLAAGGVDVTLLDLGLPDSQGVATVERAHVMAEEVPIVVLTGSDDPDLGLSCIRSGASDFIAKTKLNGHALARAIAYALARQKQDQLRVLDETLLRYREIVDAIGPAAATGQHLSGLGPLRARNPRVAAVLDQHYRDLLEAYTAHVTVRTPRAIEAVGTVARILGELGAEPSDVMSSYVNAAEALRKSSPPDQAAIVAETGPQLILELMAALLDYYRVTRRRPSDRPAAANGGGGG
jgi:DNA-binding NarL/FixJ family response regulator